MDPRILQSLLSSTQAGTAPGTLNLNGNSPTTSAVQQPPNSLQANAQQLWSALNQPNLQAASQPALQQVQPQLASNTWTQPPSLPLNLQALAGLNLSLQLLQDACAMSLPVGEADEDVLIQALLPCAKRSESYKDALNGLHGKNGHSATLWKDYYLDHKHRLDSRISKLIREESTPAPTIKKPSPSMFKVEASPELPSPISVPRRGRPLKRLKIEKSTPPLPAKRPAVAGRQTVNSLTAPLPVFGKRLPAPHTAVKIPEPPSRSPTPPAKIVPATLGNKYTPEDREFFHKFIAWRLKQDPTLTRFQLCEMLAQKAPHHTAGSWASYWSNNHDIPDKILATARGEEDEKTGGGTSDPRVGPTNSPILKRPSYAESSSSDGEGYGDNDDGSSSSSETMQQSDNDDQSIQSYDESEMGKKGEPFNDADLYITAKHVASYPSWHHATHRDRWESFADRHTERSAKSWAEYYRRYERKIHRLVRKLQHKRSRGEESSSGIQGQIGRRTRMTPLETRTVLKRRHFSEEWQEPDEEDEQAH
ncbi:hypothetical protein AX16_006472 [Volvariella volvacea WC 439]|nr:hypothetical protein AX16_006472 [Volvariella volvacea WC 439]